MPIPEDILKVERPKNTIVIAYGKDKKLYAVRERIGCKYVLKLPSSKCLQSIAKALLSLAQ